jgi:hypothetical protein
MAVSLTEFPGDLVREAHKMKPPFPPHWMIFYDRHQRHFCRLPEPMRSILEQN